MRLVASLAVAVGCLPRSPQLSPRAGLPVAPHPVHRAVHARHGRGFVGAADRTADLAALGRAGRRGQPQRRLRHNRHRVWSPRPIPTATRSSSARPPSARWRRCTRSCPTIRYKSFSPVMLVGTSPLDPGRRQQVSRQQRARVHRAGAGSSRASSTTRPRARAACSISRWSCSSRSTTSTSCTCPTRGCRACWRPRRGPRAGEHAGIPDGRAAARKAEGCACSR